ncbi:MAG TPA: LEA type 2 family protein [Chitinophagaceae bacterium]|jgi:LEA14-like dessication related protein|nr:LEA type 2 family protein [Chitinophagaceae bacterium]
MKILRIIISVVILIAFISCGKFQEPEFRKFENFHLIKVGLRQTVIGFNTTYFNPNSFGVSIKEATIDLYLDSTYIGKFVQPNPISVIQKSEFTIPLEGTISLQSALAANLPGLAGKEVLIKANGSVKVGKGGVYISKAINYQGRHVLDLNLLKNPAGTGSKH